MVFSPLEQKIDSQCTVVGAGAEAPATSYGQHLAANTEEADADEQGVVFKQNMVVIRDMLREDVAPPSLDTALNAVSLSALQKADLPQVEVLFLPFCSPKIGGTVC